MTLRKTHPSVRDSYLMMEKEYGEKQPHWTNKQLRKVFGNTWNRNLNLPENRIDDTRPYRFKTDWPGLFGAEAAESVATLEVPTTVVSEAPRQHSGESVDHDALASTAIQMMDDVSFVPTVDSTYVNWGHHSKVEKIIKSEIFYPVFVTGLSGNGKTFMVEQVCAKLKRELSLIHISEPTRPY